MARKKNPLDNLAGAKGKRKGPPFGKTPPMDAAPGMPRRPTKSTLGGGLPRAARNKMPGGMMEAQLGGRSRKRG